MISILLGLQGGYTKYPCFLCLWDSRADELHYSQRDWPVRSEQKVGEFNVKQESLVAKKKVLLPPLHIKLGLMKNFVKALNKDGPTMQYLKKKFPGVSTAKIEAGIFDGPQIRTLMRDDSVTSTMLPTERNA